MAHNNNRNNVERSTMVFSALNYKLLALGLLLVIAGFTAMYIENEVSGFISLFVSPLVIMAGYVTVIIAIMKRTNTTPANEGTNGN